MANKERGYVEIELGGRNMTLRYTLNSLAEIEDKMGVALSEMSKVTMGMKTVRTLLWAGLIHEGLTEIEVGDMVDFDNMEYVQKQIAQSFESATGKNS